MGTFQINVVFVQHYYRYLFALFKLKTFGRTKRFSVYQLEATATISYDIILKLFTVFIDAHN